MADFRVSNVTVRIEDRSLPKGVIQSHGKALGNLEKVLQGDDGGGCGCSCTCSCTCTCTSTSHAEMEEFQVVELSILRESLKGALEEVERIEKKARDA